MTKNEIDILNLNTNIKNDKNTKQNYKNQTNFDSN